MGFLWPWLAVAAAGALHGLNPATGWALLAWRSGGDGVSWRGLLPLGLGHAASVGLVAAAIPAALALDLPFSELWLQGVAGAWLLALGLRRLRGMPHPAPCTCAGATGLAVWSFIAGIAHGAGWMLVPALAPLCAGGTPGREITASGSLGLALAAVTLHMVAMLTATLVAALGARRAVAALRERFAPRRPCG
ncbi:MAG TPA: hypothetical protein VEA40_10320 [Ramlibacter sp.]|nr:hypothetical protein [Ramlibacter sp.]